MKRSGFSSIRTLGHGESIPEGEPRRYRNGNGYIRLRWKVGPNSYVEEYEHRIVAGRPRPGLDVHHRNGDKADNSPENLEVLTPAEHQARHVEQRWPEGERGDRGPHWPYKSAQAKQKADRRIARERERAAEVARMRDLYESGLSLPQVAEIVGIDHSNVYRRLRNAGVHFRSPSDYANPVNIAELVEKYRAGRSQQSLAAEYRVTSQRIKKILEDAGCPIRKPGRPKASNAADENKARMLVRQRSGGTCEVCGAARATNFQHRKNRSQGGTWSASNGLDVCGSGNATGCHGRIHQNPAESYKRGWSVPSWANPTEVPVAASEGWVLLDDEGGRRAVEVAS